MNKLYYGDCLEVLRTLPLESVDLIYLDPPFNSNRDYNAFFSSPSGEKTTATAQIMAFEDTWHWGEQSQREYEDLLKNPDAGALGETLIHALHSFLGNSDMMAYLVMMGSRLVELKKVLKNTGSLYLHCDPTASHYLKIVLDGIFGKNSFKTEISWRRTSAHNDAKSGRKQYGNVRDTIFFYTKGKIWTWNLQFTPYDEKYVKSAYRYQDEDGRLYCLGDLTAAHGSSATMYEFHGKYPYKGRYWAYSKENMEKFYQEGRIYFTKTGNPCLKRYLDDMQGIPLQNDWDDIYPARGRERVGYPTQKPITLLERIIQASSNVGDVVLDPFCGCGTAVYAAEKLGRQWIGIDSTHMAIDMTRQRMSDNFPHCNYLFQEVRLAI